MNWPVGKEHAAGRPPGLLPKEVHGLRHLVKSEFRLLSSSQRTRGGGESVCMCVCVSAPGRKGIVYLLLLYVIDTELKK